MEISVIIPTYNRPKLLRRCLESLIKQDYPKEKYEVIVVDDGSRKNNKKVVSLFFNSLHLRYFYQENKGPAASRNLGTIHAKADIIAYIDGDCVANKSWLSNIKKAYSKYPDVRIIQGCVKFPYSINLFRRTSQAVTKFADEVRIVNASGFDNKKYALYFGPINATILKSIIIKYNHFFDEDLRTREDEDLYRRIENSRLNVLYLPDNPVIHFSQYGPISDFKGYFYYGRGEYRLRQKWGDYIRLKHPINFQKLIKKYGIFWAVIIQIILKTRKKVYQLGFWYEKLIYLYKDGKVID